MSIKNPYNIVGKVKAEYDRFNYTRRFAQEQAKKKLWWDEVCRQICPDIFKIYKDHLEIDDFRVECLIVGKSEGTTEGMPAETAYDFQKKLMNTTLKGCIIQISEKLVPIPTSEAQALLSEAIYYNQGNQINYIKGNDLNVPDENLRLDHEDMKSQVRVLHDNKENMFHAAYIITIWAENDTAMKVAKSHIKGVMRENRILGELPIRKMFETFMTGQPGPDLEEFTKIELYSGLASIISPTISPISPLAGTGQGIYFGNEVNTGKDISLDFFSEAAPHAIMVGATGSGKTFALILLMIRLYLEGRKVMYLTKKRDDHTNYRAIAEYFAPKGGIIEVGPGRHNINPLQIIYDSSMENITSEQAIGIFDSHKEIFCAFMRTYCADQYSISQDSFIDQTISELYEEKGIKRNDPKTWKKQFPVMSDLREKWVAMIPSLRSHRKTTCEVLIDKTYKFSKGGAYEYINSQTDADFGLMFAVIDIVNVPKGLRESMNVLVTGILASQVAIANAKGLTIVIDEGGAFLREPQLADMILTGLTQWRSQNTQLIFATQQFGDLKKADMSEAFMANTFFKMVFGANMDESVIPYVQNFLHLQPKHVEDLKRLKRGQCLLKIRNKYVCVEVTSSDDEKALIKGIKKNTCEVDDVEQGKQYQLKPQYEVISRQNKVIFEEWLDGTYNEAAMSKDGFRFFSPQRISGSGLTRAWVHSSIIKGSKIGDLVPDHYNSVIQIGARLVDTSFEDIQINPYTDVSVVGTLNGETYAFIFDREGNNSTEQIFEKYTNARIKYNHVYIVCVASNKSKIIKAIEPNGAVPYGEKPLNMCARGTQFEDLIKDIIAGKKQNNSSSSSPSKPKVILSKEPKTDCEMIDYLERDAEKEEDEEEEGEVIEEPEPVQKKGAFDVLKKGLGLFKKKVEATEVPEVKDKDGFFFKPIKTETENNYQVRRACESEEGAINDEIAEIEVKAEEKAEREQVEAVQEAELDIPDEVLLEQVPKKPVAKKLEVRPDDLFINGEEGPMPDKWWEL